MTPDQIWSQALPFIQEEVAIGSFRGFIADLKPVAMRGNTLILETPSEFNRGLLRDRYTGIVMNAVKQVNGGNGMVEFIIPSERDEFSRETMSELPAITLNPRYTFDNFVIGSSNRFAHAAANAVAKNPGNVYNPLFVYGKVGLGKTHLMHAIGNEILKNKPDSRVIYVTSEKFTIELITAIRLARNEEFRRKYRNVDVLMVDDIQFIADKESTQEEFFHTFNTLHDSFKQIVISSDKQPKEIPKLEERLRSRFEGGLIADVQPPDQETRVAILQKKAMLDNLCVSEDVLNYIATKVESNIRELEGSLTRVIAYSDLTGRPANVATAEEALRDFFPDTAKRVINVQLIKEIVSDYYKMPLAELSSQKRNRDISYPRQVAMYLTRELTELSLPKIGENFGGRDHTTVMHACDKISTDIKENVKAKTAVEDLIKRINE